MYLAYKPLLCIRTDRLVECWWFCHRPKSAALQKRGSIAEWLSGSFCSKLAALPIGWVNSNFSKIDNLSNCDTKLSCLCLSRKRILAPISYFSRTFLWTTGIKIDRYLTHMAHRCKQVDHPAKIAYCEDKTIKYDNFREYSRSQLFLVTYSI